MEKDRGLRNILAHEYFGVSIPVIWDIIKNKLDSLEVACRSLLNKRIEPPHEPQ